MPGQETELPNATHASDIASKPSLNGISPGRLVSYVRNFLQHRNKGVTSLTNPNKVPSGEDGETSSKSNVRELQYLNVDYKGWTSTNEDHWLLLEGLKAADIHREGGFFAVGEFQNIDIALQIGATAIVLGDLDQKAVRKNLAVLQLVESAKDVSEILPKLFDLIQQIDGLDSANDLRNKLSSTGAQTGSRIRLSWATSPELFKKLKEMIKEGKVGVAQIDVTKPETMSVVGKFFEECGTQLNSAYLSNVISHTELNRSVEAEHKGAVDALFQAGGNEQTLLIRSGGNTDTHILSKVFAGSGSDMPVNQLVSIAAKTKRERAAHYGYNTVNLPEPIERAYTGSLFQYDFEFFTQTLADYKAHSSKFL